MGNGRRLPLVGVGASAGGVAALTATVGGLPAGPRAAVRTDGPVAAVLLVREAEDARPEHP